MDLSSTVKNGVMYLQDNIDKKWHPHFFVLAHNKLFYADYAGESETEGEDESDTETEPITPTPTNRMKEVLRAILCNISVLICTVVIS